MLSKHQMRKRVILGFKREIWKSSKTDEFYMHTFRRCLEVHHRPRRSRDFMHRQKHRNVQVYGAAWDPYVVQKV